MINARILAMSIAWVVASTTSIHAQDLSRYREFQLGMNLGAVAQQAGVKSSEARVLHQRPEVIQELEWQPQRVLGASPQGDSVRKVLFSFYNSQLFRIVVTYDWDRTEGLTAEDMVEAISATYGLATRPATDSTFFLSRVYADSHKVMAHWDDSEHVLTLVQSSYPPVTFRLVVASKQLDTQARAAVVEAIRLDAQEAPAREIARQQRQAEENRAKQAKARSVNKPTFRP